MRVRATARFFEDLDRQLPSERGRIVETFAEQFFTLPELILGRPEYRLLIATGTVVPAFSVLGQLAPDGAVELIQLDIDLNEGGYTDIIDDD
jgi:hypothetical protein